MRVSIVFSLILLTVYCPSGSTYSCTSYRASTTTNYCYYYSCYIYSNVDIGGMLTYCLTNYYYYYNSDPYVSIYYSGNINIELNLPSNVRSLTFNSYTDSAVTINSTIVHSSLTYLNFNYKAYHFNQASFFSYFPSLVSLSSSAYLNFTYPQTFTSLSQLTYLSVSPSSGSLNWKLEIVNDAFRGLSQLKYIELVRGDLLDVRNAFKGLTSLSHLRLEGNNIEKLEPNMFKDLHSLTILDLDGNGIKEVSDEAFVGLTASKSLSISGNPLFPLNTLSRLTGINSLQINYNSYRTLPPDPFEQMHSLSSIIADNPFFCDCSLRWTSVVSQYSLSIQSAYCLEPSKVYRTSITSTSLYTNCTVDKSYDCFSKSVSCPIEFFCRDTGTSHACTCADGYSLLHTGVCVDGNECQLGQASCVQHCNNTIGSYECYCDPGYQLAADDFSCEDIDECQMGIAQCAQSETCTNTVGSYACIESDGCVRSCDDPLNHSCICCIGYQLNFNHHCVDIDECQELTSECNTNCHNTKGSYECSCAQGYQLVNQTKCIDTDECLISNGECDNICVNTVGNHHCLNINISGIISYECNELGNSKACPDSTTNSCVCCAGYHKVNSDCIDVNECEGPDHVCDMKCHNTNGSYQSSCNEGYQLVNQTECLDTDECLISNGGCEGICVNTVGSHHCLNINISGIISYGCNELGNSKACPDSTTNSCVCCEGYHKVNSDCIDVNECEGPDHVCDMKCHNTKGSYQCSCNEGYQLVNQTGCLDTDECLISNGGCEGICVNTFGSHHCLNINISGIISYGCNELGNSKACPDSTTNSCVCCEGYHKVNSDCIDVNECEGPDHVCDMKCHNTKGSYQCSCNDGYQLVNQTNCIDIDECLISNGDCEGICVNKVGGYNCLNINISGIISYECNELGNSKACPYSTTNSCVCCEGYYKVNSECLDVNECEGSDHVCDMNCLNTKGSYQCSCNEGYQLVNQTSCIDIDECLISNGDCEGICVNTVGSHHCLNVSTSSIVSYECTELGYTKACLNPSSDNCDCCNGFSKQNSQCIDVNECQQSTHKCDMICQNTKGSYQCSCLQGFQLVNDTKCLDIDECLMNNGGCLRSCMNTNGSFVCLDVTITGNHVQQTDAQSNGQTSSPNPSIIAVMVLLVVIIIIIVFTVIIVIMRVVIKKNKYQAVFHPISNQRDNVYELPSRDTDDGARLHEKVNTSDDGISENSVDTHPAPISCNPDK